MLRGDPHLDAFKASADATRARIWRDRARAPRALRKVFTVVARRLFHPSLNASAAWRAAGVKDRSLTAEFRAFAGVSLKQYLEARRIEVADVLMAITDRDLASISERIGFIHYPTFTEAYKRQTGELPSEVVREFLPPPLIDDATSLKAGRGLLDEDEAVDHVENLLQIYPTAAQRITGAAPEAPEPRIIVDGARGDRLQAEDLWRKVRDLPFAEQCREVRPYLFHSTVFFDLLRKRSRQEGRKSRQRGIEVAELALVSLESSDEVFAEQIHELRALGWAWLGNAHRLALDFTAAAAAFEQADREWAKPRGKQDLSVLAHICALKGSLWMMRREYVAATRELDRSCSLFQQLGQTRDEARELITRATVHGYAGKLRESVEDLRESLALINEGKDKELAFAARGNLANIMARAGETQSAEKELDRARQLNETIHDPLGTPKLDWIAGLISEYQRDLEQAKRFYSGARAAFRDADELRCFGRITVDLMIVHSELDDWERVGTLAYKTLPILDSLRLHSETLATVDCLAKAVEAGRLTRCLLSELRDALSLDPLI